VRSEGTAQPAGYRSAKTALRGPENRSYGRTAAFRGFADKSVTFQSSEEETSSEVGKCSQCAGEPSSAASEAKSLPMLRSAPPGMGRRLRPPATQPVCGAPPSFVGRKDLPLQGVALIFTERNAIRAGRPDAARQSPGGVRPAVLSAHQRDSGRSVNLRCLPRPSEHLRRIRVCGGPAGGQATRAAPLLLQSHLTKWLGNSRAVSPTVRCAADDVAAWSAAESGPPPN
jgi:hypothetical protein